MLGNHGGDRLVRFTDEALQKRVAYSWHGNIRELENCIQRAIILTGGQCIEPCAVVFDTAAESMPEAPTLPPALDGDLTARGRELLFSALAAVNVSRKQACSPLGISERTLRYNLARFRDDGHALPGSLA